MIIGLALIGAFLLGMLVTHLLTFKSMKAVMNLAYKIRENMPYENYDTVDQENTGE